MNAITDNQRDYKGRKPWTAHGEREEMLEAIQSLRADMVDIVNSGSGTIARKIAVKAIQETEKWSR